MRDLDGMAMVYVPDGEFLMGAADSDYLADDDEKPQRTVYLDAFWIDEYEVTNAQYQRCVDAGACEAPMHQECKADLESADLPIACVTWINAHNYCLWAGARLPTEAEWEKAARGVDGFKYPWGDSEPTCALAQYDPCRENALVVGSKPAGTSPYGAMDMAGNVWEWVNDWYEADYYQFSDSANPAGPSTGQYHVARGGGWGESHRFIRSTERLRVQYSHMSDLGFRCAMSQQTQKP